MTAAESEQRAEAQRRLFADAYAEVQRSAEECDGCGLASWRCCCALIDDANALDAEGVQR